MQIRTYGVKCGYDMTLLIAIQYKVVLGRIFITEFWMSMYLYFNKKHLQINILSVLFNAKN